MKRRLRRCLCIIGVILFGGASNALASVCLSNESPHSCDTPDGCRAVIQQDSLDAAARLALCDLHVERGELVEAAVVLQRGLQVCTGRRGLCSTMERALSNVEERRVAQERGRGLDQAARHKEVLRGYCLGRITTERTINACEELIASQPDAELIEARVRKLLESGQSARALAAARQARELGDASAGLDALTEQAAAERIAAASRCVNQGELQACDVALLAGETDEHRILRERGRILADLGARQQAFRALAAAYALSPGDAVTADMIVGLREADYRGDLDFHRIRGAIFESRGQVELEIRELEAMVRLDRGAREPERRLQELRDQIAVQQAPPDEPESLPAAPPETALAQVGDTQVPPAEEVQRERSPPLAVESLAVDASSESESPGASVRAAALFSNAIMADGRTH